MEALGRQIIVELYDCNPQKLNDVAYIESTLLAAVEASQATIISHDFHKFNPHGVSGVVIIAESHVSLHSWPEYGYAAVDIFTCGSTIDPWIIQDRLKVALESQNCSSMEMKRGLFEVDRNEQLPYKPSQNEQEK